MVLLGTSSWPGTHRVARLALNPWQPSCFSIPQTHENNPGGSHDFGTLALMDSSIEWC